MEHSPAPQAESFENIITNQACDKRTLLKFKKNIPTLFIFLSQFAIQW